MGSMSASDAAPLPRLGEVYFDVRGESRSMRLSWYADTGVAVFSIWQGGTCTGTFRLPIADLPRMVRALQRGPDGDAGAPAPQPAAGQSRRGGPVRDPQPPAPSGHLEARRAGAHRSAPYEDDPPTGVYHEEDPGYSGGHDGYEPEPAGAYHEEDPGYSGRRGGYEPEPAGAYRDDGLPGSDSAYRDDVDYQPDPAGPYPGGRHGRYEREPTGAYSGGGYSGEPAGVYSGDPLHEDYDDERDGRYRPAGYPADPLDPDYPTGPSEPGYPGAVDPHDYPLPPQDPDYSAARPYAGPRRDAGPSPEERAHEPRRPRGRRETGPSADSFPYGQPPSEREARGHAR
jgi:hypothetical protein